MKKGGATTWIEAVGEVASYHARQKSDFAAIQEALNFLKGEGIQNSAKVESNSSTSLERDIVNAVTIQLSRIHEEAVSAQNDDTVRDVSFSYIAILPTLLHLNTTDQLLDEYFSRMREMARRSLRRRITDYATSHLWYDRVAMGQRYEKVWTPPIEKIDFLTGKLQDFALDIVEFGSEEAFRGFVMSALLMPLFDSPLFLRHRLVNLPLRQDVSDEEFLTIDSLGDEAERIENKALAIRTASQWSSWEEELRRFAGKLRQKFDQGAEFEKELHEAIRAAWTHFVKRNLWQVLFYVGAYCLFKRKFSLLDIIWSTKQPHDTDTHWLGHNIFPEKVRELLIFYALEEDHGGRHETWEGRHSTRIYLDYYFLVLLARLLPTKSDGNDPCAEEGSSVLDNRSIMDLFQIEMKLKQLIEKLSTGQFMKVAKGVWPDPEQRKEIVSRLRQALERLNQCAKRKQSRQEADAPLDTRMVNEALAQVEAGFKERSRLVGFLEKSDLLEIYSNERLAVGGTRYSSTSLLPRGIFLPHWHTVLGTPFDFYGKTGAANEEDVILQRFLGKCRQIELDEARRVLCEREPSDTLVFLDSTGLLLQRNRDFADFTIDNDSQVGTYEQGRINIGQKEFGFLDIGTRSSRNKLVALFIEKLPKLEFMKATVKDADYSTTVGSSTFGIIDLALPKNKSVREEIIKRPPAWLKEQGDTDEQENFLRTQLILEQRFVLSLTAGGEDYGFHVQLGHPPATNLNFQEFKG